MKESYVNISRILVSIIVKATDAITMKNQELHIMTTKNILLLSISVIVGVITASYHENPKSYYSKPALPNKEFL